MINTFAKSGGGDLPLQRLERAQTAFLVMESLVDLAKSCRIGSRMPWSNTKFLWDGNKSHNYASNKLFSYKNLN